jgi:carbon storage regulator
MLVLTRRLGESIVVGGDIRVTIVSVNGGKVRVAISAPPEIAVNRLEVHERILSGQINTSSVQAVAC